MEKTKKSAWKEVGVKYHWICREIDFYNFDGHRRYHLNKKLEKYDSACGQLKKKIKGKKRSEDVCINERDKKEALIRQDFNYPQLNELYS